jgi:type II secretory pathway pseudopilin PulG
MDRLARQHGFALREMAIVVLVLATLSGVVAGRFARTRTVAAELSCEENVARINQAIELWYFDKASWPANDLSDIARNRSYFPNGLPCCPVAQQPYHMDPVAHRVVPHPH